MIDHEIEELLGCFGYSHLPAHLQGFSKPFHDLAYKMSNDLEFSESCQVKDGLKKLLEAKDCFVRASLRLEE